MFSLLFSCGLLGSYGVAVIGYFVLILQLLYSLFFNFITFLLVVSWVVLRVCLGWVWALMLGCVPRFSGCASEGFVGLILVVLRVCV